MNKKILNSYKCYEEHKTMTQYDKKKLEEG